MSGKVIFAVVVVMLVLAVLATNRYDRWRLREDTNFESLQMGSQLQGIVDEARSLQTSKSIGVLREDLADPNQPILGKIHPLALYGFDGRIGRPDELELDCKPEMVIRREYGTYFIGRQDDEGISVIGITAHGNRTIVKSTRWHDRVVKERN